MNLGSIVIGCLLLIVCILPLYLISRSSKKGERILLNMLAESANIHTCKITVNEVLYTTAIGLDIANKMLFFYNHLQPGSTAVVAVKLANYKACKVNTVARTLKSKEGNYKIIDRLDLVLEPLHKDNIQVILNFYDVAVNFQLKGELQLIEKWQVLVSKLL